jgi:hypothetical protein
MKTAIQKAATGMVGLALASMLCACEATIEAPAPPPPPGAVVVVGPQVDIVDSYGYHHHGYYDNQHIWHGGYYDSGHAYHADRGDWHH